MDKLRRAAANAWQLIVDLCVDGYAAVSFAAPVLSLTFTLAKAFGIPLKGLQALSYAWALLPFVVWFFVAYVRRRAKTNRTRVAKELREFYRSSEGLMPRRTLPDDEVEELKDAAEAWANGCANWIGENVGEAARARFLDRSGMPAVSIVGIHNQTHHNVIVSVERWRQNLAHLIESDAWHE